MNKNTFKDIRLSSQGYALIIALVILAIGGLIISPSAILVSTSLQHNRIIEKRTHELYSADAGLEYALWDMKNNTELELPDVGENPLVLNFPEDTLNNKSIAITVSNEGNQNYKITSTATGDEGNTTVESLINISTGGSSVFDFAAAALGGDGECDVILGGNSEIEADVSLEGDLYAIGNICLSGNASIDGDAVATGEVTIDNNAEVLGETIEYDTNPPSPPDIDIEGYKAEAQAPDCVSCGGWTDSPDLIITDLDDITRTEAVCIEQDLIVSVLGKATFQNKVKVGRNAAISTSNWAIFNDSLCVFGNLEVSSNAEASFIGPVKVYGNLILSSNKDVVFGDTLYVEGDMVISSNINVYINGTVYIHGNLSNSGNANIIGGETIIVDGNISITGNSTFNEAAEDIPLIISTLGDILVEGNGGVAAILYAPEGNIGLSGNSDVYGAVIGLTISATGNNDIVYPIGLREREDLHDDVQSEFKILTYSIDQS